MNRQNLPEEREAAQVEEYLTALKKDPAAQPAAQLDPVMAEITRLTSQSEQVAVQPVANYLAAARARVWQKTLANLETVSANNRLIQDEPAPTGPTKSHEKENLASLRAGFSPSILPEELSPKPARITWPRLVLAGMAATVLIIVGIFSLLLITANPEGPVNPVGSGGRQVTSTTPIQGNPTVPAQPTPTPYPVYKVTLQVSSIKFNQSQVEATARVLETRLKGLGISYVKSSVVFDQIVLELRGAVDENLVKGVVTTVGRIELVDIGDEVIQVGEHLYTTYCTGGSLLKPQGGLCGNTVHPEPTSVAFNSQTNSTTYRLNKAGNSFQTIISGEDFDQTSINIKTDDNQLVRLTFTLKPDAAVLMKNFTTANLGRQLAVTADNRILTSATIQGVISDKGEISTPSKQDLNSLSAFLKSGPLPLNLTLVDMTGPK